MEAFVSKFDGGLEELLAPTLFPRATSVNAISVDSSGNVYVVGTGSNIATTPGAYDTLFDVGYYFHAFVSKFTFEKESTHPYKHNCRY